MDVKSMIENIFNEYEGERGIELTDNFEEYTGFRIVIG
jgi:hypothetical protein